MPASTLGASGAGWLRHFGIGTTPRSGSKADREVRRTDLAVLFHSLPAASRSLALTFRAFVQRMLLGGSGTVIARDGGIRMNVCPAIYPGAGPGRIINEYAVLA